MDDAPTDVLPLDSGPRTESGLPPSAMVALENSLKSKGGGRGPRSIARSLGALTSVLMLAVVAAAGFVGGVQVQKHNGGTTTSASGRTGTGTNAARTGFGAGATATTTAGAAGAAGAAGTATGGTGTGGAAAATGGRRGAGAGAGAGTAGAGGAAAATGGTGTGGSATGGTGGGGGGARAAFGGGAGGGGVATAGQVKLIDGNNIYVTDGAGNVVKVTTSDASRFTHTGQGTIADIRPGDTVVVQGQTGSDGIISASAVADTGATTGG